MVGSLRLEKASKSNIRANPTLPINPVMKCQLCLFLNPSGWVLKADPPLLCGASAHFYAQSGFWAAARAELAVLGSSRPRVWLFKCKAGFSAVF